MSNPLGPYGQLPGSAEALTVDDRPDDRLDIIDDGKVDNGAGPITPSAQAHTS